MPEVEFRYYWPFAHLIAWIGNMNGGKSKTPPEPDPDREPYQASEILESFFGIAVPHWFNNELAGVEKFDFDAEALAGVVESAERGEIPPQALGMLVRKWDSIRAQAATYRPMPQGES